MADFELPPTDFEQLKLLTIRIQPGKLVRLAWSDVATHVGFRATADYRFDSPDGSFGVLYAGFKLETAFAESGLRDNPRKKGTALGVPMDFSRLDARRVIQLAAASAFGAGTLKLIRLYGPGLATARTDNRISSIDDYKLTRAWAKAFHDHPVKADGLIYMSRYTGAGKSVVLFGRCEDKIAVGKITPLLAHPEFAKLSDKFKLAIERARPPA